MHTPVFLEEAINELGVSLGGRFIDATMGEGGHTTEILKRGGRVLALEWDPWVARRTRGRITDKNLRVEVGNFADLGEIAQKVGFEEVDGILFDLGLSYEQMRQGQRGFSIKRDSEPLDMRIHPGSRRDAASIVNNASARELEKILVRNAEEIHAAAIARSIERARAERYLKTTGDLKKVVQSAVGNEDASRLARVFQALRIEVNEEFHNLERALEQATELLKTKGRLVVITFHSLEDRRVKKFLRSNGKRLSEKKVKITRFKKPFEKSAHLRVGIKI